MTATVKIFSYKGMISVPLVRTDKPSNDSVYIPKEPYLAAEKLDVETGLASLSLPTTAPEGTTVFRVQVQDGKKVAYEMNAGTRNVAADPGLSPEISGENWIDAPQGAVLSLVEVA